jgi:hypothetical protein
MYSRGLNGFERTYRACQLALKGAYQIDILQKVCRADGADIVKYFVPNGAAAGQTFGGEHEAQPRDIAGWNQNLCAIGVNPKWNRLCFQLAKDLVGIWRFKIRIQQFHIGAGKALSYENEKQRHEDKHNAHYAKPNGSETSQKFKEGAHVYVPSFLKTRLIQHAGLNASKVSA